MKARKVLGILLSTVLVIALSMNVPASATVTVPIGEFSEDGVYEPTMEFSLKEDGLTGLGIFCAEENKSEALECTTDEFEIKDTVVDVYTNNSILTFKDVVDFVALDTLYDYELIYTLKGEEKTEALNKETWKWEIPSSKLKADDVKIKVTDDTGYEIICTLAEFANANVYMREYPSVGKGEPLVVDEKKYVKFNKDSDMATLTWDFTKVPKKARKVYNFSLTKIQLIAEPRTNGDYDEIIYDSGEVALMGGGFIVDFKNETYTLNGETYAFNLAHNRKVSVVVYMNMLYGTDYQWVAGEFNVAGEDDSFPTGTPSDTGDEEGDGFDTEEGEDTGKPTQSTFTGISLTAGDGDIDVDWDAVFGGKTTGGDGTITDPVFYDEDGNEITDEELLKLLREQYDLEHSLTPTPIPVFDTKVNTGTGDNYVQTGIEQSGLGSFAWILITVGGALFIFVLAYLIVRNVPSKVKGHRKEEDNERKDI